MSDLPYLARLTAKLADGVATLPPERRKRHADYLLSQQLPGGGFPDRHGGEDLYYTGFALRGLAVLDALTPEVCSRAATYLRGRMASQTSVVDFFSLLYSALLVQAGCGEDVLSEASADWPDRIAATFETFRTPDGGYAKGPPPPEAGPLSSAGSGSTYHSFLVSLCYELLGKKVPDSGRLVEFVLSRRREDGGFVEMRAMKKSGTNPTAAGIGVLQLHAPEVFDEKPEIRDGVRRLFAEARADEGGLRANNRVPVADLLSTFTGNWTLAELGVIESAGREDAAKYAEAVERAAGGFHGGLWDEGHDAEYTFYGLGVLGLFA